VGIFHAALLLLFVPSGAHPFSHVKLAVLVCGACGFALLALFRPRPAPRLPLLLALAWLALSWRSPLDAAAALLLIALLHARVDLRAIPLLGSALSLVVLVQWLLPGPRLRMFGTLGNPDFCAAWLGASICLAVGKRQRAAVVLHALALAALASFATALALAAAALCTRKRAFVLLAAGALCVGAVSRDPSRVLQGRVELHQIAAPYALQAPLFGIGPGAVRERILKWGAHDDWLEIAIEQGFPAMLALALLALLAVRRGTPAAAAAAALAARAFVDFPLSRPAELALFVTLVAHCLQEEPCIESASSPDSRSLPSPPLIETA